MYVCMNEYVDIQAEGYARKLKASNLAAEVFFRNKNNNAKQFKHNKNIWISAYNWNCVDENKFVFMYYLFKII